MTEYAETRPFPASISCAVGDYVPAWCRSVRMSHHDDGTCTLTAHRSEIDYARRAVRLARIDAAFSAAQAAAAANRFR